jgi:hypothetical protein
MQGTPLKFGEKLFLINKSQLNYQLKKRAKYRPFQTCREPKYCHTHTFPEDITLVYMITKPEVRQPNI